MDGREKDSVTNGRKVVRYEELLEIVTFHNSHDKNFHFSSKGKRKTSCKSLHFLQTGKKGKSRGKMKKIEEKKEKERKKTFRNGFCIVTVQQEEGNVLL